MPPEHRRRKPTTWLPCARFTAMRALPIGVPKILVTPLASGKRTFGTFMGTRDIFVLHSVIDIAGLNPISCTVFDNAAG